MTFEVKILTPDGQSVLKFEDLEAYKLEGVIENYIDLRKMSDFSYLEISIEEQKTKEERPDNE